MDRRVPVASAEGKLAKYTLTQVMNDVGGTLVLEIVDKDSGKVTRLGDTSLRYLKSKIEPGVVLGLESGASLALFVPTDAPPPPQFAAGTTASQKLAIAAKYYVGKLHSDSVPDTDHGNLACAWAVNFILNVALGHTIGQDEISTASVYEALEGGSGTAVAASETGCIVVSPTESFGNATVHGHIGIVGEGQLIYSNSSSEQMWVQNFTVASWVAKYSGKHLKTEYFRVV